MNRSCLPAIRFLLVDDLDDNLLALEALLQRDGVEFLKALSGADALELLLQEEVSLAIIDVQMPEMDGFELAELMRGAERTRHIPIIFVTAGSRTPQRIFKGYDSGAVDFFFKPLDPHVLRSKVETFYQLSRQKQLLAARLGEREELTRRLTETLHLGEMFVAALGHDMRNPLSTISTSAEALVDLVDHDRHRRIVDRIRSSSKRMSRMLDDLYDLARARLGGGLPIDCSEVDLCIMAHAVIEEFRGSSPGRAIVFAASGATKGEWDEDRLSQLLANLISNAVRHGVAGSPVTVRLDGGDSSQVFLTVHNAGSIPPEIRADLFNPFRAAQSQTQSRGSDGLGLGLYIVQQIASAHGGTVHVDTAEDTGTTFTVHLPRARLDARG